MNTWVKRAALLIALAALAEASAYLAARIDLLDFDREVREVLA